MKKQHFINDAGEELQRDIIEHAPGIVGIGPAKKRGGARRGSGRKKFFNDGTIINFRISKDLKEKLKAQFGNRLNRKFINWAERICK